MSALISFIVFLVMTFIGFPVAVSLGACTLLFAALLDVPLTVLAQSAYTGIDSFTYIAIPLFILVGNLMETGGLSKRLVGFASSLLIKFPGKLGSIMVAACAFFGAISGSASATTASIGGMMVPEMINRKYSRGYSGALAAVAGTLGAMIPPSIVMIIYALAAEVSVTDMFTAGLIPGIVMAISLMIANTVYAFVAKVDIATGQDKFSIKAVGRSFWDAKWALLTPVIILGGIYSGIFTHFSSADGYDEEDKAFTEKQYGGNSQLPIRTDETEITQQFLNGCSLDYKLGHLIKGIISHIQFVNVGSFEDRCKTIHQPV